MRRHINTLYVTSAGAWVNKDGANIVVSVDGAERGRVPVHMIGSLVCIGRVSLSPQLMGFCAEQGVSIAFLTEAGRFLARVEGPTQGNVLLRREQYRRSDDESATAALVTAFVTGKTLNQRTVIRRALRDHSETLSDTARKALDVTEAKLSDILRRIQKPQGTDSLRGLEGEAANAYFGVFDHLIGQQKESFRFNGRSRRPPLDPVNALLSLLYTLIVHDCRSALEAFGLDPYVGFLHRDRPGRPSLALDLMEELRPLVADRVALSLINRRQLGEGDFRHMENGAVLLTDDGRKTVITAFQERKKEEIVHPFLNEKTTVGLIAHTQAQLLSRHLRGDLDGYPPFVWK